MQYSQLDLSKSIFSQTLHAFKQSNDLIIKKTDSTQIKLKFAEDIFNFFHQYQCDITPFQNFVSEFSVIPLGTLESYKQACRAFKIFKNTFTDSLRLGFDKKALSDFNSEPFQNAFLNFTVKEEPDLWNKYADLYFKFMRLLTEDKKEPARKRVRSDGGYSDPELEASLYSDHIATESLIDSGETDLFEKEKETEEVGRRKPAGFSSFKIKNSNNNKSEKRKRNKGSERYIRNDNNIKRAITFRGEILACTKNNVFHWDSQTNTIKGLQSSAVNFAANESFAVEVTKDGIVNIYGSLKQAAEGGTKPYYLNFNDRIPIPHSLPMFTSGIIAVKVWNNKVAFGMHEGSLEVFELNSERVTAEGRIVRIGGKIKFQSNFCLATMKKKASERYADPFGKYSLYSLDLSDHWVVAGGGAKMVVASRLTASGHVPSVFRGYGSAVTAVKIDREAALLTGDRDKKIVYWDLQAQLPFYITTHREQSEGEPLEFIPANQGFYALFAKSEFIYYFDTRHQLPGVKIASNSSYLSSIALENNDLYVTGETNFSRLKRCSQSLNG